MTHLCCPNCRLRFTPAAAAYISACPECAAPPEAASLERTLGFRLVGPEDLPHELPYATDVSGAPPGPGSAAIMTDRHLRILRLVVEQRQRALRNYDAADHTGDAASTGRREYLARAATRTRARVADAEQRRNRRPNRHRDTQWTPSSARAVVYPAAGQSPDARTVTSA